MYVYVAFNNCPDQLNCKLHFTLTVDTFAMKSEVFIGHSLAQCVLCLVL